MKNSIINEKEIETKAIEQLQTIFDPEIPVNIFELGLVYEIQIDKERNLTITMTLTSPNCPVAESLPIEVESKMKAIEGVANAKVNIVWEPPWTPELMSEAAQLELGML
jgi:FeS assembly SUF system protein